jgi:chromosome segregation ATPase
MTKTSQYNTAVSEKHSGERRISPKAKRTASPAATDLVDVPALSTDTATATTAKLDAEIRTLRGQLSEQESLLEQRNAAILRLQTELRGKEAIVREKEIALSEIEESLATQIQSLEDQLQARNGLLERREAEFASLKEILETEMAEKYRSREARERSAKDIDRLIDEQRAAKLALAKVEMEEWHIIGRRNAWKRVVRAVKNLFEKPQRTHREESLKPPLS